MDIATMKEEQKKVNAQNAIILKAMNRKKDKFNFFTLTEHKRNKAEQKLYLLLNDDQKQDIKLICDVLGLNMDFFNYWNGRNHKIYISNNNPNNTSFIEPKSMININILSLKVFFKKYFLFLIKF